MYTLKDGSDNTEYKEGDQFVVLESSLYYNYGAIAVLVDTPDSIFPAFEILQGARDMCPLVNGRDGIALDWRILAPLDKSQYLEWEPYDFMLSCEFYSKGFKGYIDEYEDEVSQDGEKERIYFGKVKSRRNELAVFIGKDKEELQWGFELCVDSILEFRDRQKQEPVLKKIKRFFKELL